LEFAAEKIHYKTWLTSLLQSFVHFVKEPSYELVRIVVIIVVEKRICLLKRTNELFVIENSSLFFLAINLFEKILNFSENTLVLSRCQFHVKNLGSEGQTVV